MLRSVASLTRTVRFGYNNFNNWRRYYKNSPLEAEPKELKAEFKAGDQPEFMYDSNVKWPEEYKPWNVQVPYEYAFGLVLLILYIDWRTDQQRVKLGIQDTHSEPM